MTEQIKALLDQMHDAAAESFFACERFGKGSAEHLSLMAAYAASARQYEAACVGAGIAAYATYSDD